MKGLLLAASGCELNTLTGPETLDRIQTALDFFPAGHEPLSDTARLNLALTARVIGADIVERAGTGWPLRLSMAIRRFPNLVQINFTDDGPPADPARLRVPAGRLHYHRNDFGNHWTASLRPYAGDPR